MLNGCMKAMNSAKWGAKADMKNEENKNVWWFSSGPSCQGKVSAKYNKNSSLNYNSHLQISHSLTKPAKGQSGVSAPELEANPSTRLLNQAGLTGCRESSGLGLTGQLAPLLQSPARSLELYGDLVTPAPPNQLEPPPTSLLKIIRIRIRIRIFFFFQL